MPLNDSPDPRTDKLPYPEAPTQTLLTKCYLTFVILGGDVDKTSVACNVAPEFIEDYAAKEDWQDRLEATANLCSPGGRGPAEIERLLNRASLYVQAQRIRRVIDGTLSEIEAAATGKDEEGKPRTLLDLFTVHTKDGSRVDLKPLSDLTTAALKLSQMAQAAMCDTATERAYRLKKDPRAGEDSLMLGDQVLKGLSNIPANAPDSESVALEVISKAKDQIEDSKKE